MTKELHAFHNMFIEIYQKLDRTLLTGDTTEQVEADIKMKEMLKEIEVTPSLQQIFPHLLKFIHDLNVRELLLIYISRIKS